MTASSDAPSREAGPGGRRKPVAPWLALGLAILTAPGCTPFFYGGVIVLGEPKTAPAEGDGR